MKRAVIGLDTSNYRTSVAAVSTEGEILFNERELLEVATGERGLRQSDAVFAHLKRFGRMREKLFPGGGEWTVAAVAASVSPRDGEESYMPVFQVGTSFGRMMAAMMGVPFFGTTHQRGHLAAAAMGTRLDGKDRMLALHLSGGTTDLLEMRAGTLRQIGGSLDLHAGQLVDRAGVAMGLPFPAGPALEALALAGESRGLLGCSMSRGDLDCHFSGAEAQISRWMRDGEMRPEDIAREIYDLLARTTARMLTAGAKTSGTREALVTGGVASSALFREMLEKRIRGMREAPDIVFGRPEMSGDNAVGVALIGLRNLLRCTSENTGTPRNRGGRKEQMAAKILDGKVMSAEIRAGIAEKVRALKEQGVTPGLAVILVGNDPASEIYVRNKQAGCEETGIRGWTVRMKAETSQEELEAEIDRLNRDAQVHGILVQLPLPSHLDEQAALKKILPEKDVDGFHLVNAGHLLTGTAGVTPCTPKGALHMIRSTGEDLTGKDAVVIGRSNIVGKPMALLLLQENCTVTICHSRTKDLAAHTRRADILVAAVGKAGFVTADMVKPGAIVIDVGINRVDGKVTGDVDFEAVKDVAGWITPVPGGVGKMTIAMLLSNTVEAAERTLTHG